MSDHERASDRFLRWMVIVGPVLGFVFGMCSGTVITYQAFKTLDGKVALIEGWKDKQEEFNKETISAIATLKEVVRRIR